MKIRLSSMQDIPQMINLWLESFDDSREYVSFFFENRFHPRNAYVIELSNKIIGMIHFLPCNIHPEQNANYWYGVAISPEYRGKGIFTHFANELMEKNRQNNVFNLCKPADGLHQLYKKIGFHFEYFCNVVAQNKTKAGSLLNISFENLNADDYLKIKSLAGDVIWDLSSIEYALRENEFSGGKNFSFNLNRKKYVATALKIQEKNFLLTNTNITKEIFNLCCGDLQNHLNCEKISLREYGVGSTPYVLCDSPKISKESRVFFTLE